uniref:Uncharacterized protein n=1 Tax=Anguilla anguilla TaxID=7936 RepID=A0A0E9VB69_ANGAN
MAHPHSAPTHSDETESVFLDTHLLQFHSIVCYLCEEIGLTLC